jgi:hypothetical protein
MIQVAFRSRRATGGVWRQFDTFEIGLSPGGSSLPGLPDDGGEAN